MAASTTANLTLVSSADSNDNGTWVGNSGAFDLEVYIQGGGTPGSYTWQCGKNTSDTCNFTLTTAADMSATNTHLYWWAQSTTAPYFEPKSTGTTTPSGYMIRLEDSTGNYTEWHIAGSDTWGGEWKCFVLDVNNTSDVYATSGTLDLTDVKIITWTVDMSNSGNIRIIDNQWNDVVRFGTGLTITGTDWDLADVAAHDEATANRYGILEVKDGVLFCQGQLNIGNGATTTTFNSNDETIIFKDRNAEGEGVVASGFYSITFQGSGLTANVNRMVAKGAGTTNTTRFSVEADDATGADTVFDGCTFIRASTINGSANTDFTGTAFTDCQQVDPSTGSFNSCTFRNYVGGDGALLWPSDDSNIEDLTFLVCDNGVEYDASSDSTSPTFNNIKFDDAAGNFDVNNTSNSAVSIDLINNPGGADYADSYNTSGSVVTFVTNPVTTTVTVKDVDTLTVQQDARVLLYASDGTGDLHYDVSVSITGFGTTANVAHTSHGLTTGDKVVIKGANEEEYNGAYTITEAGANNYTYVTNETIGTSPATGTITSTGAIFNDLTNASGNVSDTRSFTNSQPVTGVVRKSSSSPYFKQSPLTGTISASTGLELTSLLVSDE